MIWETGRAFDWNAADDMFNIHFQLYDSSLFWYACYVRKTHHKSQTIVTGDLAVSYNTIWLNPAVFSWSFSNEQNSLIMDDVIILLFREKMSI